MDHDPHNAGLIGDNNSLGEDCPGVRLKIVLDEDLRDGYQAYIADPEKVALVPTEYYTYQWLGFSGNPIKNTRGLPDASLIDASVIRLQSGTDYYMQQIIGTHLDPADRVELSRLYRSLRETFAEVGALGNVNAKLAEAFDGEASLSCCLSMSAPAPTSP